MLQDQVVAVTGGARGIGLGIAECALQAGARVALLDLDGKEAAAAAATLGERAVGLQADASVESEMAAVLGDLVERWGGLHVMVNNAGIGGPDEEFGEVAADDPILSMSDEIWDTQLRTNLRTTFASSKAAIPLLGEGGSIVNISSIAALNGSPQLVAYGAAKAGVVHLTSSLARHLASKDIRVNAICPGLLYTRAWEILASRMQQSEPQFAGLTTRQVFEAIIAQLVPLGREQTPHDIGHLVVFLSSPAARNITGQVISVDGGVTLGGGR